ncbi:unnamed protein product [Pedinophyceae sp. YPF-701]|nr:unnamed protein product [Pedinophyceae sp. YPF-701]
MRVAGRHVLAAVHSDPASMMASYLDFTSDAAFIVTLRGIEFAELANQGRAWTRISPPLQHFERTTGAATGTADYRTLPVHLHSPAQSARLLADAIAAEIERSLDKGRAAPSIWHRGIEKYVADAPYVKGYKVRIKGRIGKGKARTLKFTGGSFGTSGHKGEFMQEAVAHARIRMGVAGVKVWLVFHSGPMGPMGTLDYERARYWREYAASAGAERATERFGDRIGPRPGRR